MRTASSHDDTFIESSSLSSIPLTNFNEGKLTTAKDAVPPIVRLPLIAISVGALIVLRSGALSSIRLPFIVLIAEGNINEVSFDSK